MAMLPSLTKDRLASLCVRLALGTAFLSAVADRFGLWGPPGTPGVAWGNFGHFLSYTASLVPFGPPSAVALLGWAVTVAEIVLGLCLLMGYQVRIVAGASALLLLAFALGMMLGDGVKAPFDASVFSAAAGAFLLHRHPSGWLGLDGPRGVGPEGG